MKSKSSTQSFQLIPYLALFTSIIFSIAGQLLMKYTMSHSAGELFSWTFIQRLFLALTTYTLGIVNWILALRTIKLSIAYPLTSLNYVGILLGSYYFFDEQITLIRVIGVVLIFVGVLLVVIPVKTQDNLQ